MTGAPERARGDQGAALVEMAVVANLLFLLLFGIITFGLLLGYRQNLVQAANEAARAGAVGEPGSVEARALAAANQAAGAFGKGCAGDDGDGLTCLTSLGPCPAPDGDLQCLTVVVHHDNVADPTGAPVPLLSAFYPDEIEVRARSVVTAP